MSTIVEREIPVRETSGQNSGLLGSGAMFFIAILLLFMVMNGGLGGANLQKTLGAVPETGTNGAASLMTLNRYAGYADPQIVNVNQEVTKSTGALVHILDGQTAAIREGQAAIIAAMKDDKMADLRDENLKLAGKLLQQETLNAVQGGNCEIRHELDRIKCEMVKQPPFQIAGGYGYQAMVPFGPYCGYGFGCGHGHHGHHGHHGFGPGPGVAQG